MDDIIEGEVTRELATVEAAPPSLFGTTDPVEVIDRASKVADALKDVLRKRGLIAPIQGKEYVTLEGWTTLGAMLGVFPVDVWTRPVEVDGKCIGWEARVEARTLTGQVVGAAEAECLSTERRGPWSKADDYALRSMAQTRASSKALRMPLGFVVTLAGYSPTPAEEMDFAHEDRPVGSRPEAHVRQHAPAAQRAVAKGRTAKPPCPKHGSEQMRFVEEGKTKSGEDRPALYVCEAEGCISGPKDSPYFVKEALWREGVAAL